MDKLTKFTNSVFLLWNILIYYVFASPNVRHMSNAMTWLEASTNCEEQGLEDNEDKLKDSDIPIEIEFWIGRAVYSEMTPWIEVLGCTSSTDKGFKLYKVETIGQCQHKCDVENVFGYTYNMYKGLHTNCVCFPKGVPTELNSACENSSDFLIYRFFWLSLVTVFTTETVILNWTTLKCLNIPQGKMSRSFPVIQYVFSTLTRAGDSVQFSTGSDYNGTIKDDLIDPGNCVTVCCGNCLNLQRNILVGRNCFATNDNIVGRCTPFNKNDQQWGNNFNTSRYNCWQKNKLLLSPSFCTHTTDSSYIRGVRAWTNVFRENFDVEKSGLHQNPTLCYKGILHNIENETKQLDISLRNCNDGLKWFICKNTTIYDSQRSTTGKTSTLPSLEVSTLQQSSTTNTVQHQPTAFSLHGTSFNRESKERETLVGNTFDTKPITVSLQPSTNRKITENIMKKDNNTNSYTGVIIGGTIGAFFLLILSAAICVCRKKSLGIFKGKKNTKDKKEECSQTPNYNLQCVIASHVEPISNQNYGIATNLSSTYAVVNKLKKLDKKFTHYDETYSDLPDGQYDQLNNVQKRKIILEGNLYDSHEGMRDHNDPTYDISKFSSRHEVTDLYDRSFLGTQNDGEYDYSSTYRSDILNETEMYDKTV